MKILKTVLEPCEAGYHLSVAIESRPGHWKAYEKPITHFPTLADVVNVANTGAKIFERRKAEHIFGMIANLEYDF